MLRGNARLQRCIGGSTVRSVFVFIGAGVKTGYGCGGLLPVFSTGRVVCYCCHLQCTIYQTPGAELV